MLEMMAQRAQRKVVFRKKLVEIPFATATFFINLYH